MPLNQTTDMNCDYLNIAGKSIACTGQSAIKILEYSISDAFQSSNIPEGAGKNSNLFGRHLEIVSEDRVNLSHAVGLATTGLRTGVYLQGKELVDNYNHLAALQRQHVPLVIYVSTTPFNNQMIWDDAGHRNYHFVSEAGCFQLFASNVQELIDFGSIAHKIAELSLIPGIVALEGYQTAYAVHKADFPSKDIICKFLGQPDDMISAPTPAQEIIFGKNRRRIPNWFNFEIPTLNAAGKEANALSHEIASQKFYFLDHLPEIIEVVFEQYAELTGRAYNPVSSYRIEDAEYVVLCQGAAYRKIIPVVEQLRKQRKLKTGCLGLSMLRPFPSKKLIDLLIGKKTVTVLEQISYPSTGNPPLFREIAGLIQKNNHQHFPSLLSGIYSSNGDSLSYNNIISAFENMTDKAECKTDYLLDVDLSHQSSEFPKHQILIQDINRSYPLAQNRTLHRPPQYVRTSLRGRQIKPQNKDISSLKIPADDAITIQFCFSQDERDLIEFTEELTNIVQHLYGLDFKGEFDAGRCRNNLIWDLHLKMSECNSDLLRKKDQINALFLMEPFSCGHEYLLQSLQQGAVLFLDPEKNIFSDEDKYPHLEVTPSLADIINQKEIELFTLSSENGEQVEDPDAVGGTGSSTMLPRLRLDLRLAPCSMRYTLIGAVLCFLNKFLKEMTEFNSDLLKDSRGEKKIMENIIELHDKILAKPLNSSEESAILKGLKNIQSIEITPSTEKEISEIDLPFTIRQYKDQGPPYSKLSRFYNNTSRFYHSSNEKELVADPFQSLPAIPSATANFNNLSAMREYIPKFKPENCTGCGACYVWCPHAAIPPISISVESLIKGGMDIAASRGIQIIQLTPVVKNLAKIANKLISESEEAITKGGDFLFLAFEKAIEQMKLEGERLQKVKDEFNVVNDIISNFQAAVTEPFLKKPSQQEKDSGELFSLAIDLHACSGCGICANVCQEDALEMVPQTNAIIKQTDAQFQLWEQLPDTPSDTIIRLNHDKDHSSFAAVLLSRNFYKTMTGGTTYKMNTSQKTMMHLTTALAESVMQPRFIDQIKETEEYINSLQDNIHQQFSDALPDKDIEDLSKVMEEIQDENAPFDKIISRLSSIKHPKTINTNNLKRKVALLKVLKELLYTLKEGDTGTGRARFGTTISDTGTFSWAKHHPYNPFTFPTQIVWDGISDLTQGLFKGHLRHILQKIKLLRSVKLEAKDNYKPEIHDKEIASLTWKDLDEKERSSIPPLFMFCDMNTIFRQNLETLNRMLSSQYPLKVFVFDDLSTSGISDCKSDFKSNILMLSAISLRNAFILKSSLAVEQHLFNGLIEGIQTSKPALFHLFVPSPENHDSKSDLHALSLHSRAFPVLKFNPENSKYLSLSIDLNDNPAVDSDWFTKEIIYLEKNEEKSIPYTVTFADWAFTISSLKPHFHKITEEKGNEVTVEKYIRLNESERQDKIPFILQVERRDHLKMSECNSDLLKYAVSQEIITAVESSLKAWNTIKEMGGLLTPFPQKLKKKVEEELSVQHQEIISQLKSEYEKKLKEQEQEQLQLIKQKLKNNLMKLANRGNILKSEKVESQEEHNFEND